MVVVVVVVSREEVVTRSYTHKSMIHSLPKNLNRRSLSIVMGMREGSSRAPPNR